MNCSASTVLSRTCVSSSSEPCIRIYEPDFTLPSRRAGSKLSKFKQLDYEPVTDVFFLEGQEAATILSLFL